MEMKQMGLPASILNNVLLKDFIKSEREEGRAEGRAEGREEGGAQARFDLICSLLEAKFGPLPGWALDRVRQASREQVDTWVRKGLKARSLEGVIGRQ
ncbi:MAG: hypothetical protein U0Q16_30865 [Bryobacteraceae bacterium]